MIALPQAVSEGAAFFLGDNGKVSANISKIDFTVTIYKTEARSQNFGQVSNAYIRVVNEETGEELIRYLSRTGRKRNFHL